MIAFVVEDNIANYVLVREILRPLGWDTVHVMCAGKLNEELANKRPNLIIMDILLPDGDGIELTRELRSKGVDTPIVVMSAHAFADVGMKAIEAGASAFFPKPFDLSELEDIVRSVTSQATA